MTEHKMESKTPLVDSLFEPSYFQIGNPQVIYKRDLEAALEKLTKVTGAIDGNGNFHVQNHSSYDTHTARLLGIQEITKEPVKVELETKVGLTIYAGEIKHEKLKQLAGKKVRVTVEEIEG